MDKVRLASRFWSFLGVIPNMTLVIVLLLGALAVGREAITLGTLVAFITLMLSLVWPVTVARLDPAMAQEAMTAADRIARSSTPSTVITVGHRGSVVNVPRPPALRAASDSGSPRLRRDVLHDVDLDLEPGETSRWSAPPAPARPRSPLWSPGCTT